jgi:hypothetical protein
MSRGGFEIGYWAGRRVRTEILGKMRDDRNERRTNRVR